MFGIIAGARWARRKRVEDAAVALRDVLADRYRLGRKLGEGGMAEVHLADDLRHGRTVAVKVLRPEVAAGVGAGRFLSEIRLTARLRHPNVLPLYDSGEEAGRLYYVMPLVEGESLADRIAREGPLAVDETVRILRQVSDALEYAHERGVIHRDIKPSNILLERGHAIVADFGIARAVWGSDDAGADATNGDRGRLTGTGTAIGSPQYMSPEQASGGAVLDARADQYSLACVAYEMLAGAPPFSGPTPLSVMARHALDPVPPLNTVRPGLSRSLAAAIERALAKTPADRFTSVGAFADELVAASRRGTGDTTTAAFPLTDIEPPRSSIAVLPFANLSGDPEQAYFAGGMHDAVIAALSRIAALTVISRTTMLRYQDTRATIPSIAAELGVGTVMEGSVLRAGDRVRITLQLFRGSPEQRLWSETYEHDITDVLALHGEVAVAVAGAVQATLTPEDEERLCDPPPVDPKVYELYLRGRYQSAFVPEQAYAAVRYFREAIERAPDFAPAHSGLARRYIWLASLGLEPSQELLPMAAELAARAYELYPCSADALAVLGYLRFTKDWDSTGARAALEEAIELEPGNLEALVDLAFHLCTVGEFEDADRYLDRIAELDPFSQYTALFRGWSQMMAGRYDDSVETLETARHRYPAFAYLPVFAALAELRRGGAARAVELARAAEALDPESPNLDLLNVMGAVYAEAGCEGDARRILAQAEAPLPDERGAWFRWLTRLILGEEEAALEWFERAFEQRNPMLVLLPVHPIFEIARTHPVMGERIRAMRLIEHRESPP